MAMTHGVVAPNMVTAISGSAAAGKGPPPRAIPASAPCSAPTRCSRDRTSPARARTTLSWPGVNGLGR